MSGDGTNGLPITRDHVVPLPEGASPRVCIFAAFNAAYQPLADIARPNWEAYAKRHGYALRFYPEGFHLDPSRPTTYGDKGRFNWYYDLRGHCDIVMYLDIDSLFMNMAVKAEALLYADFAWTYSDGGPQSGLWVARTDATTEKHLRFAYERAARESNIRHGVIEPHGISDQDSMTQLMRVPPFEDTFSHCYDADDVGHCTPESWKPGKWIVQFGGLSFEQKLSGMVNYRELAR